MRVIDFVEGGGSRRGAADEFEVSVSSAIRWVQRFREDGTCEPMPRGGSTSPLEKYSRQILAFISAQRDLTLDEIVLALHKRRIPGSRSALSRFFARHGITFKKSLRAAERKRADVARARRRWIRTRGFFGRDFRVKMWGTSLPDDKLTGDLGKAIAATQIRGCWLDPVMAENLQHIPSISRHYEEDVYRCPWEAHHGENCSAWPG